MIAALFVIEGGCYYGLDGIDPWPESRDARTYAGPHAVIAHPPCQRWGALGVANFARWGGDHNRPGNDGGCFASAMRSVRRWGGVLEHPARSLAWDEFGLVKPPKGGGWVKSDRGWTCEVWQSAYGHKARKATWLYYCGGTPSELRWERIAGTHQVGFQDRRGKDRNKPTLSRREANATPILFRDALITLAYTAEPEAP